MDYMDFKVCLDQRDQKVMKGEGEEMGFLALLVFLASQDCQEPREEEEKVA